MLDLEKVFILQLTSGPGSKTSLLLGLRAWEPQCFDCLTRSKFEKANDLYGDREKVKVLVLDVHSAVLKHDVKRKAPPKKVKQPLTKTKVKKVKSKPAA